MSMRLFTEHVLTEPSCTVFIISQIWARNLIPNRFQVIFSSGCLRISHVRKINFVPFQVFGKGTSCCWKFVTNRLLLNMGIGQLEECNKFVWLVVVVVWGRNPDRKPSFRPFTIPKGSFPHYQTPCNLFRFLMAYHSPTSSFFAIHYPNFKTFCDDLENRGVPGLLQDYK